jgi:hypothetical protein
VVLIHPAAFDHIHHIHHATTVTFFSSVGLLRV